METVSLNEKFGQISEYWSPHIAAEVNETYVKLVKFQGEFVWHHHDLEDELFLIVKGRMLMRLRDGDRWVSEGEFIVIPHGVEHCPYAPEECWCVLIEPNTTLNTGNLRNERTRETLERI
jgi:mannose-6-phosphate isomerase-like protein (cupin superfamily)